MTIQRMDHVGVVVEDLPAAKEFFIDLGLEVVGEWQAEGGQVDRVTALEGVRAQVAMLATADGSTQLEISQFLAPTVEAGDRQPPSNAPGLRHLAFAVDDMDDALARLRSRGHDLVGEVETFEEVGYRDCYVRGPEGIIVELAERIAQKSEG